MFKNGIGPQRDLYSFEYRLFSSYVTFLAYDFLQGTFNLFPVWCLYSGHCFDGVVVSFHFMIDSL